MRQRPARTFVAWTLTVFVSLLFAFPNYCEKCSYRDVSRLLAAKEKAIVPACCAKKGTGGAPPGKEGKSGGTHVRYSYCLSKTLPSIAESRDILREIRLAGPPAHFIPDERNAVRFVVVLDHKDCRGPPA